MLFHEIYGTYFRTVENILREAQSGGITDKRIYEIVRNSAFGESGTVIPSALKSGRWPLLKEDGTTPLRHMPRLPVTDLERRWLKALLQDPRVRLFGVTADGLEDVEPLYEPDTFVYFDQYQDGDPYESERYRQHFQTILEAIRTKRMIKVSFIGGHGIEHSWKCIPERLDYSAKDDKFRLIARIRRNYLTVNLARIRKCSLREEYEEGLWAHMPPERECAVILEISDERNAMERAMLDFSHFRKETVKKDDHHYRLTIYSRRDDESELLIRVLAFGPMLRVVSPENFRQKVKQRIDKQMALCHEK